MTVGKEISCGLVGKDTTSRRQEVADDGIITGLSLACNPKPDKTFFFVLPRSTSKPESETETEANTMSCVSLNQDDGSDECIEHTHFEVRDEEWSTRFAPVQNNCAGMQNRSSSILQSVMTPGRPKDNTTSKEDRLMQRMPQRESDASIDSIELSACPRLVMREMEPQACCLLEEQERVNANWSDEFSSNDEWSIRLAPGEEGGGHRLHQTRKQSSRRSLRRVARRGSNESIESLELSTCPRLENRPRDSFVVISTASSATKGSNGMSSSRRRSMTNAAA